MASNIKLKIYDRGADTTDAPLLDIFVNDNSYRNRAIMGDNSLTLYYSLPEHVELPVGAWCEFEGEVYTLGTPEAFKMKHSRNFEYTVTMEAAQARAKLWKFRNPREGRLSFSLTAKPQEHLQMFVDNMNRRDAGWTVGDYIQSDEKVVTYDHSSCLEALQAMAREFETEFEIVGKVVNLRRVEHFKDNPLPLSYGRGNGFKSGIGRSNGGDDSAVEILFAQGGSQNIDPHKYGSPELLLPKDQSIRFDGERFEDEEGFNADAAATYTVEYDGRSIYREGREFITYAEDSLDCSEIYPKRECEVRAVQVINPEKNFYDIIDDTIPENLEYIPIEGETMSIIFQSGQLAGREFEVSHVPHSNRFKIVPAIIDGAEMPSPTFPPQVGNKFIVLKCALPDAYVCDNASKSGASWDMFRKAVRYLYEHEQHNFSFSGQLDGIWAKNNWSAIASRLKLGGFIRFTDARFQKEPVLLRIVGIKDNINDPHSPTIELSNGTVSGGFSTTLKTLESKEVVIEDKHKDAIQFTKRRFRDAQETMEMLEGAVKGFSEGISPVAVKTMQMIAGDEALQFRFVDGRRIRPVAHRVTYNQDRKVLMVEAGTVQHMTLGIDSVSPSHAESDYLFWDIPEFESEALTDPQKRYYLYIQAEKNGTRGIFRLSEEAVDMDADSESYFLLVGVLGSEYDGNRSYSQLYGFTEVLPGQITTDRIVSTDGGSFFDMLHNALRLGESLDYNSRGDGKLRIRGSIVQSPSGAEGVIGVFRGTYSGAYTYYLGDEVTYETEGAVSTYRCVSETPIKGVDPTNTRSWSVVAQGGKGTEGKPGAAVVFRGAYDPSTVYFCTAERKDVVKYQGEYWIADSSDEEEFWGEEPEDLSSYWRSFGADFESVATGLLLAENANIAGFIFKGNKMWSQWGFAGGVNTDNPQAPGFIPNMELDGVNGVVKTGSDVYLKREGLEISKGDAKTLVRNQSIAEMVAELVPVDDAGEIAIPAANNQHFNLGLREERRYTLIFSAIHCEIAGVDVYGMTSDWVQVFVQLGITLNIYDMEQRDPIESYEIFNEDILVHTEDSDPTGTASYLSTIAMPSISKLDIDIPKGCWAELEIHIGKSKLGNCSNYIIRTKPDAPNYLYPGSIDWSVKRERQWTLIGNDGIYVMKNGAALKIVNSDESLQISVKGLPVSAPAGHGSLWVDKDGSLKVS